MEFDVLSGPSLPELARTALARAPMATVTGPSMFGGLPSAGPVPVRSIRDGSPLLLPPAGSQLAQWLAARPDAVRVSLPARAPFSALRITGTVQPVTGTGETGITACLLNIESVEFTGAGQVRVPVTAYRAAAPDPLWRVAPRILRHLEKGHMTDLVGCVRAHGLGATDWVIPRGLDRYGLELLALTTDGVAVVRLAFPSGPVSSLEEVPASLRTALTCRCQSGPGHLV